MDENRDIVVVDIGSHKLEELMVLLKPGLKEYFVYVTWLMRLVLRPGERGDGPFLGRLRRQLRVLRYYFLSRRDYRVRVISIEPNVGVAQKFVEKLGAAYPVSYLPIAVLGHDASTEAEIAKLFFYDHSISSSLYKKDRPMDEARANYCVAMQFGLVWRGLCEHELAAQDSEIILRMNCEGSELGVLEACRVNGVNPLCVIGSIGDMDKIHGQEAGDETRRVMEDMKCPYHYFKGSDPATWHDMIDVWEDLVSRRDETA